MRSKLKIYTSVDFEGVWPASVAAVVLAVSEEDARELLNAELTRKGLRQLTPFTLTEVPSERGAVVLCDGDY